MGSSKDSMPDAAKVARQEKALFFLIKNILENRIGLISNVTYSIEEEDGGFIFTVVYEDAFTNSTETAAASVLTQLFTLQQILREVLVRRKKFIQAQLEELERMQDIVDDVLGMMV